MSQRAYSLRRSSWLPSVGSPRCLLETNVSRRGCTAHPLCSSCPEPTLSTFLRLNPRLSKRWRRRRIHTQCSFFVTLPAMNSLYFWSGEEAPPDWTNTWFYTSNTAQQQELIKQITGNDRSRFCVVDNQTWLSFWYQGHAIPQLPLARLVEKFRQDNSPPTIFGSYRLFVAHNVAS